MKSDTQHLEYLISQYVDGCLDPAGRKSVEQQLLNNPGARQLYKEQRDVQDLLDDWGNRIPLANWDEFNQRLASRLEGVSVGGKRRASIWARWGKPLAVAAGLSLAAGIGYWWHGTAPGGSGPSKNVASLVGLPPRTSVVFTDQPNHDRAESSRVEFPEAAGLGGKVASLPVKFATDTAAVQSLRETILRGLPDLPVSAQAQDSSAAAGAAMAIRNPEKESVLP